MNRPALLLTAYTVVYVGLLSLFTLSIADGEVNLTRGVWVLCGSLLLSSTALEVTLLGFWLHRRALNALEDEPWVPGTLTEEERLDLDTAAPPVAILMPAHREVTTPEDAEAFTRRLVDIVCRSPRYSTVFLLFDSPHEQHDNELRVVEEIRNRVRRLGRPNDSKRVRMETYRDKPRDLRNKPGSIQMWIERNASSYEYMFVLDADSSFVEEDASKPETCDVVARLVLALERHPELAMAQTAIDVHTEPTIWGWLQQVGCRMASRYHGRLFQWLLDGAVPSYGHSVMFRVSDFVKHVKNTLQYLSHDFLDAADLAAVGRKCIYTYSAVTREEGEASLLGFVKRDLRWARGNAQWANYWLTKPGLPLGPRIFLAIGVLCYVWPLLAALLFVLSVFLVGTGAALFDVGSSWALHALFACVVSALVLPKAFSSRSLADFSGSILVGTLISPSLTLLQGVLFLLGAFGTSWTLRGSRSSQMDLEHVMGILRLFFPISLLGLSLWCFLLHGSSSSNFGEIALQVHVLLLIASPIVALALSIPVPEPWARDLDCGLLSRTRNSFKNTKERARA